MPRGLLLTLLVTACAPPVAAPAPPIVHPSAERDFDGDGFVDPRDRCPRDVGAAPFGCPATDDDGDGILPPRDRCPDVPGLGLDGCPPPDADADAVPDDVDACPDSLETRNGFQDGDGCADAIPKDLARFTGPIKGVQFDLDKDTLRRTAKPVLDRAAEVLKRYPDVRLEIVHHTDSTASPAYSNGLSHARAAAVQRYLVGRGIDGQRLEHYGAGPNEPLASNKTAKGRARNRRIEFHLLVR